MIFFNIKDFLRKKDKKYLTKKEYNDLLLTIAKKCYDLKEIIIVSDTLSNSSSFDS